MNNWMLLSIGALGLIAILFHLVQRILKQQLDKYTLHYIAVVWAPLFLEDRVVSHDDLRRIYAEESEQLFGMPGDLKIWEAHQFLDDVGATLNKWFPTQQAWHQTVKRTKQSLPETKIVHHDYTDRFGMALSVLIAICVLGNLSLLMTHNYSEILAAVCEVLILVPSIILISSGFRHIRAAVRVKVGL